MPPTTSAASVTKRRTEIADPHPPLATIPFVKAHACGNDFLLIDEPLARNQHAALARRLCARNTGIGADGIEFLDRNAARNAARTADRTPDADLFLRLFNADGSEAELSGNGTRCVAAWLAHSEGRTEVALATHGGLRTCRVVHAASPLYQIETSMGVPRVMPRTIVLPGIGEVPGAMVNVGNPHFVVFLESPRAADDFSAHDLPWQQLGAAISTSPLFPHGTNVEFVQVLSATEIAFRIFERGCGPTLSSGTGTCAASAAAMALRGTARELTAIAEGGPQRTAWPAADAPMLLTGPAEIICRGEAL
jgi:diaminopimelate epimerase